MPSFLLCATRPLTVAGGGSAVPSSRPVARAVIVGGGLAGLAAAAHLSSLSVPFLLLDASSSVGGRVATDRHPDGFLLDRGFHILLTAFPESRRILDYSALRLRPFYPGALVYRSGAFHLLSDPFRRPFQAIPSLLSPLGSLLDYLLVAAARFRAAAADDDSILAAPETTTAAHLAALGFSPSFIEAFLRPFLAGIFFDTELSTSSRLFNIVFKSLALGDNAIPEAGIRAIPSQLAARLPDGSVRLNSRVTAVHAAGPGSCPSVVIDGGETVDAELGVIVAVEQPEAKKLLQQLPTNELDPIRSNNPTRSRSTVCIYFSADRAPVKDPILILNGSGWGIVNNMFFVTNVAPSYAPAGKVLVSVSLIGAYPDRSDDSLVAEVVRELSGWFGSVEVEAWTHLRTYRISFCQPDQTPPTDPNGRDPRVDKGVYICGDHWSWATFDGTLISGRRAAEAMVRDLNLALN